MRTQKFDRYWAMPTGPWFGDESETETIRLEYTQSLVLCQQRRGAMVIFQ